MWSDARKPAGAYSEKGTVLGIQIYGRPVPTSNRQVCRHLAEYGLNVYLGRCPVRGEMFGKTWKSRLVG